MGGGGRDLAARTQEYALRVIRLVEALPPTPTAGVIGKQLVRCATSVGANYRSARRAKSTPDFIAKMCIVEEEADESLYWLELLVKGDLITQGRVADLREEGNELVAIAVASIKTAKVKMAIERNMGRS